MSKWAQRHPHETHRLRPQRTNNSLTGHQTRLFRLICKSSLESSQHQSQRFQVNLFSHETIRIRFYERQKRGWWPWWKGTFETKLEKNLKQTQKLWLKEQFIKDIRRRIPPKDIGQLEHIEFNVKLQEDLLLKKIFQRF